MKHIGDTEANAICQILDGFHLTEQVACLASLMFCHILAAVNNDTNRAEPIVQEVIGNLPHHWQIVRGLHQFEQLQQPTSPPN